MALWSGLSRYPAAYIAHTLARLASTSASGAGLAADAVSASVGASQQPVVPGATLSSTDKMVLMFTCRVCETRTARTISKPAYTSGVVLVRCPGCQKLHLIADRLGYFVKDGADVESLLAARGERVRRSSISPAGLSLATGPAAASGGATVAAAATGTAAARNGAAALLAHEASEGGEEVLEFSAEDLAVLQSASRSVDLRARSEAGVLSSASGAGMAAAAPATEGGELR